MIDKKKKTTAILQGIQRYFLKVIHIDGFSSFEGGDPIGWILKAEKYICYNQFKMHTRLTLLLCTWKVMLLISSLGLIMIELSLLGIITS